MEALSTYLYPTPEAIFKNNVRRIKNFPDNDPDAMIKAYANGWLYKPGGKKIFSRT